MSFFSEDNMPQILEALMMVLFGCSWPFNIIKSIKTKSAKGKSAVFLFLVDAGYLAGILSKLTSGNITWVLFFYVLNFLMVLTDIVLYFVNKRRDLRLTEQAA